MTLQLRNISLAFPDGTDTRTILDDVDLDIAAGETVVVTGQSGSGKSTLLAISGLLMSPDAGTVTIAGRPATGLSKQQATKVRRDHVGIIYQASNLFPALTCREQLELVAHLDGNLDRAMRQRATQLLHDVGLEQRIDARPAQLSGGERQRVGIARALMNEPELILADEPTASLDPERGAALMVMLLEQAAAHGTALMIVSHTLEQLPTGARRLDLCNGRLAAPHASAAAPVTD
ncbi:MAG TPA: ABC transporter ATP-binding protein [Ilumatobacteraceae bacterium]|nr:ABC transporter ATP-binding protein [Ilumatobacteraceae bacterium]HRB03303.1 ABC transporter ATP-binding protein [Ilumatobacteraceae bacterium]